MSAVLTVAFAIAGGPMGARVEHDFHLPDGVLLTSMEVTIDGDPIVAVPFALHGGKGYHTICQRDTDHIDVVRSM